VIVVHLARLLFAIIALCAAGLSRSESGAQIRLLARAEVGAPFFTLGDIADIQSADSALQERLSELRMGQTPRTGYRVTLVRAQVEDALARALPSARQTVHWAGAQRVSVRGGGQPVNMEQATDLAARAAIDAMRPAYGGLDLQPVGKLEAFSVPQGEIGLRPQVARMKSATKRLCVPVEVTVDGQIYRTVYVWFAVRAMQKVWVAKHSRPVGEPLLETDFRTELRDVAALSSEPVDVRDAPLRTLRLRRSVEAGRPLLSGEVETRPAVLRSAPVAVKLITGAIAIETNGVALDDGRVGQYVRVRNSASGETFSARVIAEQSVVIEGR
jgi:flagella basal body P-ring formation protein FlgA